MITLKKITKVTVRVKDWHRGKGGDESRLLTKRGKMCCLGFECLARGFTEEDIRETSLPEDMVDVLYFNERLGSRAIPSLTKLDGSDTKLVKECIYINDDADIDDETRMAKPEWQN